MPTATALEQGITDLNRSCSLTPRTAKALQPPLTIMGPLGTREIIVTFTVLLFYVGLFAAAVFMFVMVFQIRRQTAEIRNLLLELQVKLDERMSGQ